MKRLAITVTVLLALALTLAGCGQSEFSMVINEDNTGVIIAGGAPGDTLTAAVRLSVHRADIQDRPLSVRAIFRETRPLPDP